jgi:hypothetical protein
MDCGPIFIGGPDRCGKTTMRAFLVSHPNIAIPAVGSNMWTYFYRQYGDLAKKENFERCLRAMLNYKHVAFLNPNPGRIRAEFNQGQTTYGRLFELFLNHYSEREGKPRWGVQTGLIERYADVIFHSYNGSKMLHMIRDPRDRYEASLALWPRGKGRAGGAVARWRYSIKLGNRNLSRYPDQYKLVRYESLVTDLENTLRDVCTFLGENYLKSMLTMDGAKDFREQINLTHRPHTKNVHLSTKFIGRYKTNVSKDEVEFIQTISGREMLNQGYQLDMNRFSLIESLKYRLRTFPANLFRMFAWRLRETVQHHIPTLFGRKPNPRMLINRNRELQSKYNLDDTASNPK